jgi:hypothetical protein
MPAVPDPRVSRIRPLQQVYSALQTDLPRLEERIELLRAVVGDNSAPQSDNPGPQVHAASIAQHRHDLGAALYEYYMHVQDIGALIEAETHLRLALPHFRLETSPFGPHFVLGSVLRELAYGMQNRLLAEEALSWHRRLILAHADLAGLERALHRRELGLTLRVHYSINPHKDEILMESVQQLKAAQALFTMDGLIDYACSAGLILALLNFHNLQVNQAYCTFLTKIRRLSHKV